MMAFVINNSPQEKLKKKKNEVVPEPPSYLVLMPFQPPAKLFFEHIKMGQEACRILKIRNPSDNPIHVVLDKLPDPKIGLSLSHTEFTVDQNNEFIIQITFKPLLEGSGRECIHVKDVNKNKKLSDIFINWDSINPNPPKLKKKKPLILETKILMQNKVIGKKAHVKNASVPNKPLWKSSYGIPSVKPTVTKSKTNYESTEDLPPCNVPGTPTRRQTYNVDDKENLDINCGIYSNQKKRSPRLGRSTVLSPLPLLTKGRLKSMQNKREDNFDHNSIHAKDNQKVKQLQSIRNLQVSEDILHLGPSDESEDEVVYLGNKTYRKHSGPTRRDTYLIEQTNMKQALPSDNDFQNRRNTYNVDFNNTSETNFDTHSRHLIPDVEFTGQMFIEEEIIRETTITRTPVCKRSSFSKRGSWDNEDTHESHRRKSIEMVNGKLRIKKSSLGKLYNEYRRRSSDRFSIDSLDLNNDDIVEKIPVDLFEDVDFDTGTISSPIEIPEHFNPRRTSTDLKQQRRVSKNSKQSKKKMDFITEPLENINEQARSAFDDSLNSLKVTTNDLFDNLLCSIKPFEDLGNLSGVSSIKFTDALQDGTYLSEGKLDKIHYQEPVKEKPTENPHVKHIPPSGDFGETYIKESITDNTYVKNNPLTCDLGKTYLKESTNENTSVRNNLLTGEFGDTYIKEDMNTNTDVKNNLLTGETLIKKKSPPAAWGETFHKSRNITLDLKNNATYCVPYTENSDVNQYIPQPDTTRTIFTNVPNSSASAKDIPDHVTSVLTENPLKNLNEKISSIEFAVNRCEQKRTEVLNKCPNELQDSNHDCKLASIPESNESKLRNSTSNSSDSYQSAPESMSPTAGSTIGTDDRNNTRESDKPARAWAIEISPPSKLVEEKKQPGTYDFLIKYQQARQVTRSIRRPTTSRIARTVASSTPKINNKSGNGSLDNNKTDVSMNSIHDTKTSKSIDTSTSSSDRSKSSTDLDTGSAKRSVSRKRRSNSNTENGPRQGPPPGKLLRTSSQDMFKKPVPVKPPVRKAAGLPMKSLNLNKKKKPREESVQFYNPEKIISDYTDSNLLIATGDNSTPFSVGSLYMDPKVLDDLERDNIKWLNSLLTPPLELECDAEGVWCVDIADLWLKSSRTQNVELAPSREKTAMKYHGQQDRLDALRKAAFQLFRSSGMSPVLSKLSWHISKNLIEVRKDRDLHLDQGLQQKIISLLLCYNPLWLRIGLEAVYGCTVPLHHNNDVVGLTGFMRKHLVNDPYTRKQHAHPKVPNLMDASFADAMKKFILRKFLMVVYFLDRAKSTKLIRHDPCLFIKKSKYKDSAQLVIEFSRDLISGGDILRHLRTIGYVLEHKQTFLNEFDFSTKSLLDLRDGVRLARAMEIILHQKYLTKRLRAPAISRLQKVHNVEISMSALQDAGYDIQDDISAKDIADGHREKTLSLLWQIIYKFQAPRYDKAALTIQHWWKNKGLFIEIRRRIRAKLRNKQNAAAIVLQSKWKGILIRRKFVQLKNYLKEQKKQRLAATILIQKTFRRYQARTRYLQLRNIALRLQRVYRHNKVVNTDRERFVRLRQACVTIQRFYRNYRMNQTYKNQYERVKVATARIQRWFRSVQRVQADRDRYLTLRRAVINCQNRFRANRLMRSTRREYIEMKQCAVTLQRKFRATRAMQAQRKQYNDLKTATVTVQKLFRAKVAARKQRAAFLQLKRAALAVQRRYRANRAMRVQRDTYLDIKQAARTIQTYFKSYQLMKSERARYVELRHKIVYVQRRFRAIKLMTTARDQYRQLIKATLCIQRRYRAHVEMTQARAGYTELKRACVLVQQKYRARKSMLAQRSAYLKERNACVIIQRHFRSYQVTQQCRTQYLNLKAKTIFVQSMWRSKLAMRRDQLQFCMVKNKTIVVQKYFRGYLLMKKQRQEFLNLKTSAAKIQEWYRSTKHARQTRAEYLALKRAAVTVQSSYRALLSMRRHRTKYTQLRTKTILLQQQFRAFLLMKKERNHFNRLKHFTVQIQRNFRSKRRNASATKIQNYYRGYRLMLKQRAQFLTLRRAAIAVQTLYRAKLHMRHARDAYVTLRQACVAVQQRWRANVAMKKQRAQYLVMKQKTILIQQWYRNTKMTRLQATHLAALKSATVCIQRRYRATLAMRKQRQAYLSLRSATLLLQRRFRSYLIARNLHEEYLELKQAVLNVQRRFRATRHMRLELDAYARLRQATQVIQSHYRQYVTMKTQRQAYLALKQAVRTIETRVVANRLMKAEREHYLRLKQAVSVVQVRYRARLAMKRMRDRFLAMKSSVRRIEQWYVAKQVAVIDRHKYLELRFFTVMIQRRFRFKMNLRKYARVIELLKLKKEQEKLEQYKEQCAVKIQSLWKMYQVRKKFAAIIEQKKQEKKTADNQFENQAPLYVRLEEAISGLSVGTDLYCVIKSLYNLDTVTTLSPKLCVGFTNKGLIPMLYQYLQSANRSEPNKIMAIAILRVFINLARFDLTAPILWKVTLMVDGLNTIVDLIKIWYDKNDELMCAASTLLWLFSKVPANIVVINNTEHLSKKLLYVFSQLDRKKKPKKSSGPQILPGAKADWGLGYRGKVFTDPLYAATTVCRKLGLLGGPSRTQDSSRISVASASGANTRLLRSAKIKHSL